MPIAAMLPLGDDRFHIQALYFAKQEKGTKAFESKKEDSSYDTTTFMCGAAWGVLRSIETDA